MLKVDNTDPLIYLGFSRTFAAAGDNEKALDYLKKALQNGYEDLQQLNHNVNMKKLHHIDGWDELLKAYFPEQHKN